jgi:hypothetical protein
MEVTTAIGVISFALVALLGVFPLGLENGRMSVSETRAGQLVRMVTATLVSEPFTAAPCFSQSSKLNLAEQASWPAPGSDDPSQNKKQLQETSPVVLYVTYDPPAVASADNASSTRETPQIVRANVPPEQAVYRIELRFRPETLLTAPAGATTTPTANDYRLVGTTALIRVMTVAGETGLSWKEHLSRERNAGKRRRGLVLETQTFVPVFNRTTTAP